MTHRNSPLSFEGRRRLVERCRTRPMAHVAAEMGISRACASKWVNRWRRYGGCGIDATIPVPADQAGHRRNRGRQGGRSPAFDREIYRHRNTIERGINRLKQHRAVATRYEKLATRYLDVIQIAAIDQWL